MNKYFRKVIGFLTCISILIISISPVYSAGLLVPNSVSTIQEIRDDITSWKGKFVAFSGGIEKIVEGYQGKSILTLRISENGNEDKIVVGSLFEYKPMPEDEIAILGIVTDIKKEDALSKKLTNDKFMVLGMCWFNVKKIKAGGSKKFKQHCDTWFNGQFPNLPN